MHVADDSWNASQSLISVTVATNVDVDEGVDDEVEQCCSHVAGLVTNEGQLVEVTVCAYTVVSAGSSITAIAATAIIILNDPAFIFMVFVMMVVVGFVCSPSSNSVSLHLN